MKHTVHKMEWRVNSPADANATYILRAINETNRLLAEIGTLLEERLPEKTQ